MNNGADWPADMVPGADNFMSDSVRLWRNDAGSMTEVAAAEGIELSGSGKAVLRVDYDHDGDLDLFYTTNSGYPALYRNDTGNVNDWLRVETRGIGSNRDGIGARVEILSSPTQSAQLREIRSGNNFLGQSERVAHFGLGSGPSEPVGVRVTWPRTGQAVVYDNVPRNSVLLAVEPLDPLPAVKLTAGKTSPVQLDTVGDMIFTATAVDASSSVEYRFFIRDPAGSWFPPQEYSSSVSFNAGEPHTAGTWRVFVHARHQGSEAEFEAESMLSYEVNPAPISSVTLTADKPAPVKIDTVGDVIFTAVAIDATSSVEYQFSVQDPVGTWLSIQDYSSVDFFNLGVPSSIGTWVVRVRARHQGSEAEFETETSIFYQVNPPPISSVNLTADKPAPVQFDTVGEMLFTAAAVDATSSVEYQFFVRDPSGTWLLLQEYSSSATFNAGEPSSPGNWVVLAQARQGSDGELEAQTWLFYKILP